MGRRVPRDHRVGALRAGRLRGQPALRGRAADDGRTPTRPTAIERGIDGAHFFGYSLAHYYVFGEHRPGRTNIYEEFLAAPRRGRLRPRDHRAPTQAPLGVKILQQGLGSLRGAIGTPDQVRELSGATRRPASTR